LRRADAEEVDVAELGNLVIGRREPQATGREVLAEQGLEARLVERHLAVGQLGNLGCIDVEAEHLEAELRHAHSVRGAEVAGAQHGQAGESHFAMVVGAEWQGFRCGGSAPSMWA